MENIWKCSGNDCDGEATTGWFIPQARLVCKVHHEQLADRRAVAIPTENGGMVVQLLAQHAR